MASVFLSHRLPFSSPLFVAKGRQFIFSQNLIGFRSRLCLHSRDLSSWLSEEKADRIFTEKLQAKLRSGPKEFAVPKNFPFEIVENVKREGKPKIFNITFNRSIANEKIIAQFEFFIWDREDEDEEDDDAEEIDDNGNNTDEEDGESEADEDDYNDRSGFIVEIDKGDGRKLMLLYRYPGKFSVRKLKIWGDEGYTQSEVYNADLLKAAQKCLEARGIDRSFVEFAEEYFVYMNLKHIQPMGKIKIKPLCLFSR